MTVTAETLQELLHVDPTTLIIGTNVRAARDLPKSFVDSIRERGVLQPITAYLDDDGRLVVLRGQRRTLAAVQAERPTVPVYVVDSPAELDRIVDQVSENDHRDGITTADRVRAYEQLAAVGLSAGQIAKRTASKRTDVEAGLRVVSSTVAVDKVTTLDLTLDQAAAIAEFDTDEKAVGQLLDAAGRGGFDHQVQRLRDQREENAKRAGAEVELAATGVTVVPRPAYDDKKIRPLESLLNAGKSVTAKNHASCPGHAAYVQRNYGPADEFTPVYVCTDAKKHGHTDRHAAGGTTAAALSDEDREKATAERRRVIAGNKAWKAATAVRRRWLAEFCHRKQVGDHDVERFIAEALVRNRGRFDEALNYQPHAFYLALTAGDENDAGGAQHKAQIQRLTDELASATRPRALAITAGLILAAWEAKADDPQVWRQYKLSGHRTADHDYYLAAMASWGYELSSIELALVKHKAWTPE